MHKYKSEQGTIHGFHYSEWPDSPEVKETKQKMADDLDIGFRVLKLDDTNMEPVYYSAQEYSQDMLQHMESNIKPDRTDLDLLFGCLLEWGLPLSMPYRSEQVEGLHRPHLQRWRPDRLLRQERAGGRHPGDRPPEAPPGRVPGQQFRHQSGEDQRGRDFQAPGPGYENKGAVKMRIPYDKRYTDLLGQAVYAFAYYEWTIIHIIEHFQEGFVHIYSRKEKNDIRHCIKTIFKD